MQLATAVETAQVEDLIERIGISETLNLLAAVCAVKSFIEDDREVRIKYSMAGIALSDLADKFLDTVSKG